MRRIGQFLALARLTTLEAMRQPVCLLLTAAAVLATALTPLLILHNFGEEGRLVRDSGLACHLMFGLFVAGYGSCSSLSREMRSGTASAVLSKPVGRTLFFSAKFAGVAAVVLMFSVCTGISTLLAERCAQRFILAPHVQGFVMDRQTTMLLIAVPFAAFLFGGILHYRQRGAFQSSAFAAMMLGLVGLMLIVGFFDRTGDWSPYDLHVQWRILPASILITLALIMLSALALTLSTRLSLVPTMTLCVVLFLLGLMSDYWFGGHAGNSRLAWVVHAVLPNWQQFWVADFLAAGGHVPARIFAGAALYATAGTAALLCIGAVLFDRTEVK